MDNSLVPENRNEIHSFDFMGKNQGFLEMEILRKAYELILENSDLFFTELTNAFTQERERKDSNLLI